MQHLCWISSLHGQPSSWRTPQPLSIIRSCYIHSEDLSNRTFKQFCLQFSIPTSPLTLHYFCCSRAHKVSHKTIKVHLAGIQLEHIERGFQDPTTDKLLHLLCKGIKCSHGTTKCTCLPITINILCILKCKLREEASYSLIEKRLLWLVFTLKFYGLLRTDEFTTELSWSSIHLHTDKVTVFLTTIKDGSIPPRSYHWNLCHRDTYSTCPVRTINQYPAAVTPQQVGPLFKGGRFFSLTYQQLTSALHHLLRHMDYNLKHYASHSFKFEAITITATASLPAWLIKILGQWSSKNYQLYIHL